MFYADLIAPDIVGHEDYRDLKVSLRRWVLGRQTDEWSFRAQTWGIRIKSPGGGVPGGTDTWFWLKSWSLCPWYLSFCDWFVPLSTMSSRFIHGVAGVRICFQLKTERYALVCTWHVLLICSYSQRHVHCFHFSSPVNKAAVNPDAEVRLLFAGCIHPEEELLDHKVILQAADHSGYAHFYISTNSALSFQCLRSLTNTCSFLVFAFIIIIFLSTFF